MAYDDDTIRMHNMIRMVELISMMSDCIDDLEEEIFDLRIQLNDLAARDEKPFPCPYGKTSGDDSYLFHPLFKATYEFIAEFGV
ncbi:MAG: hypothetical protein LBN34_07970 [Clostridiales Family XIII bacterium]|jgi:hypothetical protein|nr:hypothetical protein [Clostridiales Family XIII bacterium]